MPTVTDLIQQLSKLPPNDEVELQIPGAPPTRNIIVEDQNGVVVIKHLAQVTKIFRW